MNDLFVKRLACDAAETLWRIHRHSTLFALLSRGKLTVDAPELTPVAAQLNELADARPGPLDFRLHGEKEEGVFSEIPEKEYPTIVHVFVCRSGFSFDPNGAFARFIEGLRLSHRIWFEGGKDVSLLVCVPKEVEEGWTPLAQKPFPENGEEKPLLPNHVRRFISEEGLYTAEVLFRTSIPTTALLRIRQISPAFPVVFRGVAIDTRSERLTFFSGVPVDYWSYHRMPYNDSLPVSIETCGAYRRVAFRVRLSGGAEAHLDMNEGQSVDMGPFSFAPRSGDFDVVNLRLDRVPYDFRETGSPQVCG